ncbi:MAG: mitochondrial fission ELM1 family protein [Nitrospirales bacterium]
MWVLTDDRPGNTTQSLGLADALGWPYIVKELSFSGLARLHKVHERLLGATTLCLDKKSLCSLVPPWPEVVISAGRRAAPIARWIRKQSQGKAKLIQLGRKGSQSAHQFDVSISPAYCHMWPSDQRIETLMPLNRVTNQRLDAAAQEWKALFGDSPHPHIVLLVGGSTVRYVLDQAVARRLGNDVLEFVKEAGGTLHVVTSRRTGQSSTNALVETVRASSFVRTWEPGQQHNPYWGYLAVADVIIVTGDSESMVGESVAAGKHVYIYPLPENPLSGLSRFREWIVVTGRKTLDSSSNGNTFGMVIQHICALLLRKGLVRPLRDLNVFHRGLIDQGYAFPFGQEYKTGNLLPLRESEVVSRKVKSILGFQDP